VRVNTAIADGSYFSNSALVEAMDSARREGKAFHLLGLVSDGNVHASMEHIYATLQMAKERGLSEVYVHAILDGRDTGEKSASQYLTALQEKIDAVGIGQIVDMTGRFYAMDRDLNWGITDTAVALYTNGTAVDSWSDAAMQTMESSHVTQTDWNRGGIDLNSAWTNLEIKRDANGVPLPLGQQKIDAAMVAGFTPAILNIVILPDLKQVVR